MAGADLLWPAASGTTRIAATLENPCGTNGAAARRLAGLSPRRSHRPPGRGGEHHSVYRPGEHRNGRLCTAKPARRNDDDGGRPAVKTVCSAPWRKDVVHHGG